MNDKELADAVVALGVGFKDDRQQYCHDLKQIPVVFPDSVDPEQFVTDWRVAGALMEKLDWMNVSDMFELALITIQEPISPRPIIEACVAALREK